MSQAPGTAFDRFLVLRRRDLQRIARHTRGELQLADVVQEAWILATTLPAAGGEPLDLSQAAHQQRLLSHLYQHLVRYTELNVRHAVRLDHAASADGERDEAHPLSYQLVSNEGRDPLGELLACEAASEEAAQLDAHGSLAAAYVHLLHRFDNKMSAVADHLLISMSYAYRCCAQARQLAARLEHIPVPIIGAHRILGPWRRFRLHRTPVQLAFDFDDELPFSSGR